MLVVPKEVMGEMTVCSNREEAKYQTPDSAKAHCQNVYLSLSLSGKQAKFAMIPTSVC